MEEPDAPPLEHPVEYAYGTTTEAFCKSKGIYHGVIYNGAPDLAERAAIEHLQEFPKCRQSIRISRWLFRL
jgi:hypothetical protein